MAKSKEALLKAAEAWEKLGKKKWAEAKSDPENKGFLFQKARENFNTAKRAKESAERAK